MKFLPLVAALALVACQSPVDGPSSNPTSAASDGAASTQAPHTGGSDIRITEIATGLEHPWSVALLPDGGFLITERPGRLLHIAANGAKSAPISGVPPVWASGQGGLLDVVLAPDFATSKRIYLSYAEPGDNGTAGTAVSSATLGEGVLTNIKLVYRQEPKLSGGNHFGSRLAFDGAGHIFISQGERNDRPTAQKLDMLQGKLVRLHLDGRVPRDNPFVGKPGVRPEIWSYGHRNMQGLAFDPRTNKLWESEHGPRGGDELNLPQPGRNYGWPIITHGIDYSGIRISESVGDSAPDMEQPHHVWAKSPGLSGMAFLTGRPGTEWNDSLFLGSLAESNLIRLQLQGDRIVGEERLLTDRGERIRDVRVGKDGNVYVLTDEDDGKLLKLEPPKR